jgi:Transposase domain (DUF772)
MVTVARRMPSMMVTLVLYGFATNVRSSRRIECHCRQDVAYRMITGNLVPDHATIARFIDRHQVAFGGLFTGVLEVCEKAGLVESGVVSIDATRIAGNASPEVTAPSGCGSLLPEAKHQPRPSDPVLATSRRMRPLVGPGRVGAHRVRRPAEPRCGDAVLLRYIRAAAYPSRGSSWRLAESLRHGRLSVASTNWMRWQTPNGAARAGLSYSRPPESGNLVWLVRH